MSILDPALLSAIAAIIGSATALINAILQWRDRHQRPGQGGIE